MPSGENMGIKELATELEIVYSYTERQIYLSSSSTANKSELEGSLFTVSLELLLN